MPTTPLYAEGLMSEPEVSEPTLTIASSAATPAADPELEPLVG